MQLTAILLQTVEIAPTVWERLGDQLFSVLLLFCAAYFLWRRQTKLEDKLMRYMEEDRNKMLDVISANTRVMERIEDRLDRP